MESEKEFKSPEAQKHERMVVNEQTLLSMMQVPFDNFEKTLKMGDPNNSEVQELNKRAASEYEEFQKELSAELDEEIPTTSPEVLQRILNAAKKGLEQRKAQAARDLGPEATETYWAARQDQIEKQQKGKPRWKHI